MKAPLGSLVRLTYDPDPGARVRRHHILRTSSGRCYLVLEVRRQLRGKHAGRLHLACLVVDAPKVGATVHELVWYRRR